MLAFLIGFLPLLADNLYYHNNHHDHPDEGQRCGQEHGHVAQELGEGFPAGLDGVRQALAQGLLHIGQAVGGDLLLQGHVHRGVVHLAVGTVQAALQAVDLVLGISNLAFQRQQVA